jgi:hypothetical protein
MANIKCKVGDMVVFYPVDGAPYTATGRVVSITRRGQFIEVAVTEGTGAGRTWVAGPEDITCNETKSLAKMKEYRSA